MTETKQKVEKLVAAGKAKVDSGGKLAKQCGGILDSVVKNAEEMNRMVTEIATASNEQSVGVSEITKAMGQLDQVTHENAATSQQAAGSAQQLLVQADSLQRIVALLQQATSEGNRACQIVSGFVTAGLLHGDYRTKSPKATASGGDKDIRGGGGRPNSREAGEDAQASADGGGTVIPFPSHQGLGQVNDTRSVDGGTMKKVAGGEGVPLKSDPRFEEV